MKYKTYAKDDKPVCRWCDYEPLSWIDSSVHSEITHPEEWIEYSKYFWAKVKKLLEKNKIVRNEVK